MRLDKYLKVSRIIKRRTVANDACPAKASYQVKEGDVIEISFGSRTLRAKVVSVAEHAGKSDAASMYEVLSEE